MIKAIRRVTIGSSDLTGALSFFAGTLNLPLVREVALRGHPTSWDMGFSPSGPSLAVSEAKVGQPGLSPGEVLVEFETDDIEGDYQALQSKGLVFTTPPTVEEWEGVVAYFRGPDGVKLGLVQPRRSE